MKYQNKYTNEIVKAIQFHQNSNFPKIKNLTIILDNDGANVYLHPGDWIVKSGDRNYIVREKDFERLYFKVNGEKSSMKLEAIIEELKEVKEKGYHGFIEVTIPGQNETEFIINKPESIDNKIEYYKRTYDDNGIHKKCSDIKIVDAGLFVWGTEVSKGEYDNEF